MSVESVTELVADGDVLPLKNTSDEVSREENTVAVTEVGPGVAQIKQKYIVPKRPHRDSDDELQPPPQKRSRGQNKYRPPVKLPFSTQLCPSFHIGSHKKCSFGDKCRYLHDVHKYLQVKLPDINEKCYIYETFGVCPSGLACRYGNGHIDHVEGKSIVNESVYQATNSPNNVMNTIPRTLQEDLRKRRIKFPRSEAYLATIKEGGKIATKEEVTPTSSEAVLTNVSQDTGSEIKDESVDTNCNNSTAEQGVEGVANTESPRPLGPITDEDSIRLKPSEKKKIDFKDKLYLAPLTTVGNLPFRRICKKYGADITCSEMALCTNLLQGQQSEWALMKRHESEDLFGIQVCGSFPDTMAKCAELITNKCSVDFIDINTGCPIDLIFKKGAGCALMQRKTKFQQIVTGMSQVIDIPLTVKMRTGVYDKNWNAHKIVPLVREWGASLVTIHGRSREQRYTKLADWDYIDDCAKEAAPMPLFGNGDILSFEDYDMFREHSPHVSGTMIARGALIKPWVFTEIKEQRHWDISSSERLGIVKDYVNFGLEHWGSDTQGVERVRRFLLEWLSFLHRYIPYGLLERTQKLNERPPYFIGRDDLETLMASRNCKDWVKISEMFLGPVPDSFSFLPKHKANSYS